MSTNTRLKTSSRLTIVGLHAAIALATFTGLRALLSIKAWPQMSHAVVDVIAIFSLGLFYDAVFIVYGSLPFVLLILVLPDKAYQSRWNRFATCGMSVAVLFGLYFSCAAEWFFWEEFGTRFNFIAVDYLVYTREVTRNIVESYPLMPILMGVALAAGVSFGMIKKRLSRALSVSEPFGRRLGRALPIFLAAAFALVFIDQSLRGFPNSNYARELASNGPYQFVAAFRNNVIDYQSFYAQGDTVELDGALRDRLQVAGGPQGGTRTRFDIRRAVAPAGNSARLNVMLITVESLSAKYLKRFGSVTGATPFMDQWFQEGMLLTKCFATGTRTTRGLEALTLSVPPTPGRSIVKRPDNGRMFSLGKVLRDNGYDTAFLYGGRGFFDNMNAFFTQNGYRTIDQSDFSEADISFQNAWGVADEDLYRKALKEADRIHREQRPFFFHLLTTSNHRPYTYPEGRIDLPSGSGRTGAVQYTDYALKQFIDGARGKPWFADTLFVLVADHCAGSAGEVGLNIAEYHIPLFFFSPGRISPSEIDTLCSQIDVAPTILGLLSIPYESHFFGDNILSPDFQPRALLGNYQKLGFMKDDMQLALLSPGRKIELQVDDRLTPLSPESPLATDLMAYYQGADYILRHRLNRW